MTSHVPFQLGHPGCSVECLRVKTQRYELSVRDARIVRMGEIIGKLRAGKAGLAASLRTARRTIADLRGMLGLEPEDSAAPGGRDSTNSSRPPSSDAPWDRDRRTRERRRLASLRSRQGSRRRRGAQPGHPGSGMPIREMEPEDIDIEPPECASCPDRGSCGAGCRCMDARNVVDMEVVVARKRYRLIERRCPRRGLAPVSGSFPEGVTGPRQYGPGLRAAALSIRLVGIVSYERTAELLRALTGLGISEGTICSLVQRVGGSPRMLDVVEGIRGELRRSPCVNVDETGGTIDGSMLWIHTASDGRFFYLMPAASRGRDGMVGCAFLPTYGGIIVHDCWRPYWQFDVGGHALCCVHLVRELVAVGGDIPAMLTIADGVIGILLDAACLVRDAAGRGATALDRREIVDVEAVYEDIVARGADMSAGKALEYLERGALKTPAGKAWNSAANLFGRLWDHRREILLFIRDFRVPFSNNLAERSLRLTKVFLKVSGQWVSWEAARSTMRLVSFIRTAGSHGVKAFEALRLAVQGRPADAIWGEGGVPSVLA